MAERSFVRREHREVAPPLAAELQRRGYRAMEPVSATRRYALDPAGRRLSRPELIAAVQEAAQAVGFPKVSFERSRYWQAVATEVKDWLPLREEDPAEEARRADTEREAARLRMREVRARHTREAAEAATEAVPRWLETLPAPMSGADAWRHWRKWTIFAPEEVLVNVRRVDWLAILRESGHATGEGRKLRVDPRPEAAGAAETA